MNFILTIQNMMRNLVQILESLVRILLLSKWRISIPKITSSKPLAILANGPSLINDMTNFPIDQHELLCVNHFPTTALFQKLKPAYYVTAVPELWIDNVDERYIAQRMALWNAFSSSVNWPMTLFIPFESRSNREWTNLSAVNANITVCYFNNVPVEGPTWFSFWGFKKNLGMPRPHNVLVPSLMLGLNMGYKNIDLIGVDHSWLPEISVSNTNEVLLNQKHFYDEGSSKHQPMDIKGKGKRNLSQVLYKFMHTFAGYYTIEKYAHHLRSKIKNCTKGSFIDAFERG